MKRLFLMICALAGLLFLSSCGLINEEEGKKTDLEFTVLPEEKLPEELKEIIEQKKQEPFRLTFKDQDYLYICSGYGEQKTGGYSICVNELYRTSNAVYFDATLIGPAGEEKTVESASYPYIVVKLEYQDLTVVFE